ncbi:oligosaccharide flippase family protein [Vibrio metschnikovii]|nr:oligosaccharide flippase family protein [Vibrio metschnikovii]
MSNQKANLISNYVAKIWSVVSNFIFVPFYLSIFDESLYGVIIFHASIILLVNIADSGLSPAFSREVARELKNIIYVKELLSSLEKVYLTIILLVLVISYFSREWLSGFFFADAKIEGMEYFLFLMFVSASFQMAMSLYRGAFVGADKQVFANTMQILYSFIRSGLVIILLYITPTLDVYFYWQALISFIFLLIYRWKFWGFLGGAKITGFYKDRLYKILKFSSGMFILALIGAFNTQIDKFFVTKMLSSQDLAVYYIASLLSQVPYMLTLPIAVSCYPKLVSFVKMNDKKGLFELYSKQLVILSTLASLSIVFVFFYGQDFLISWTGKKELAFSAFSPMLILALGSFFLSLQLMPYHLSLSYAYNKVNIFLGLIFIFITPVLLYILISKYSLIGAAIPWLIMNLVTFVVLNTFLFIKLDSVIGITTFLKYSFSPACIVVFISIITCSAVLSLFRILPKNFWLVQACLSACVVSLLSYFILKIYFSRIEVNSALINNNPN